MHEGGVPSPLRFIRGQATEDKRKYRNSSLPTDCAHPLLLDTQTSQIAGRESGYKRADAGAAEHPLKTVFSSRDGAHKHGGQKRR